MRPKRILSTLPLALLAALPLASCMTTADNGGGGAGAAGGASASCDEFQAGATFDANVRVDARVRSFMQASADLGDVAGKVDATVRTACAGIATDLGVPDTWSALGDSEDAIANAKGTGACDAASVRIVDIMSAHASANFALVVARGECHADFEAEAACEAGCSAQQKCDAGTVVTRCAPADLSVACGGKCASQAFCEGHADAEASCEGKCEAECVGTCSGSWIDPSGHARDAKEPCNGKCADHCSGKCRGRCQIDASAGIECGASVSCRGGCTSQFTSPKCESEFTPPKCTLDASCFESCRASVSAKAVCEPPTVKLFADANAGADVAALVATIDKNLPALVQTAEAQGHIVVGVGKSLATSAQAVLQSAGSLDVKSLACATVATKSLAKTTTTFDVATTAGAKVTSACSAHAK